MAGLTKGVGTGLTKCLIFFKVVVQSPKNAKWVSQNYETPTF